MFARIIQWSIHNKFLVLLSTIFLIAAGVYSLLQTPLDAIPDLSDVQVIVYTEYPGQAPQIVEDQVTYPLTTQMLAVPYAKVVRGYSFFGFSFVYIIFEDGTDLYWARSRVLESLNYVSGRLPKGVTPTLGPDATGVGWAFMYALKSDRHDLGQLRSIQDWYLKYALTGVPGVAEVASIGGFVKQYQVTVDPNKLRGYNIPISKVRMAIQRSNSDVGGRLLEVSEKEFMIRGLGYIKSLEDLDKTAVGVDRNGTPILLKDIATVQYGPEIRRGLAELDGQGETAGGIVIVRSGANARQVIQDVKAKLAQLKKGLPEGVRIQVAYDRSELIERAVETLRGKLLEESIVVAIVCIIFLLHFRSALVAIITLPVAILMAFIVMHRQGINANIMSLGGIAIAIGAMVDAAIIMIENAHKHMERDGGQEAALGDHLRCGERSGPGAVLFPAGDCRVLRAGLHAGGAGRASVQAVGVHKNLLHGCRRAAFGHVGSGSHGILHPRQNPAGTSQPDQPLPGLDVSPDPGIRASLQVPPVGSCSIGDGHYGDPVPASGFGVHAVSLGRRSSLHADHASGSLDHKSPRGSPANGQDHQDIPRSGACLRKSRPRRDRNRSRPAFDDRDRHHAQTGESMAERNDG